MLRLQWSSQPKAAVGPAEVGGTAHQIHPGGEDALVVDQSAIPADQRNRGAAEGRVEPLDVRRVEHGSTGYHQRCRHRLGRPPHDPPPHAHHAPLGILLDHLAQEQPLVDHQPGPAPATSAHGMLEDLQEGGDVAGQAIHTHTRKAKLRAQLRTSCTR